MTDLINTFVIHFNENIKYYYVCSAALCGAGFFISYILDNKDIPYLLVLGLVKLIRRHRPQS